jgi:HEPN domain-containing protein
MPERAQNYVSSFQMKTNLSHLPLQKQHELALVVDTIQAHADVEMILLFGSYARGDWVEDNYVEYGTRYEYKSDFDILVILDVVQVSGRKLFWNKIEERIRAHPAIKTRVSLIEEDYRHVEQKLAEAHYFYSDIYREGVILYDAGRLQLEAPKEPDLAIRKRKAEEDFEYWYRKGLFFFDDFLSNLEKDRCCQAAFMLHQATENFYNAILLVYTGYKAKVHDIETLGKQAASHDPRFLTVFPLATLEEKQRFKMLKDAYIDARYNRNYNPGREDLAWLAQRVERLGRLTEESCKEKIAAFGSNMPPAPGS